MSFWDAIEDTAKSLGRMASAVPGVVYDTATMVFDDKDDTFGDWVNTVAGRGTDLLDPLLNEDALTAMGFNAVMDSFEATWRQYTEPVSATSTMLGHVAHNPAANWSDIFSGRTWGEAFETARNRSVGQSNLTYLLSVGKGFLSEDQQRRAAERMEGAGLGWAAVGMTDPLDERAWKQIQEQSPLLYNSASGASDFVARWYADPGVILGKGIGAYRAVTKGGKITQADAIAGVKRILDGEVQAQHGFKPFDIAGRLRDAAGNDLKSRYEKVFDFMETGANGAPLNETQIFLGLTEVRKAPGGRRIAGLLAEAGKIEDPKIRRDQWRSIFAVVNGDTDELARLGGELEQMGHVRDELKNIAKGSVVDLKATALGEQILASPALHASLQGQLDRAPKVTQAVESHIKRLELLIGRPTTSMADDAAEVADTGVFGVMKQAAGVSRKGKRAIARDAGQGLLRDGQAATGFDKLDSGLTAMAEAAQRWSKHASMQTVYQDSLFGVPARIITQTAGLAGRGALAYARAPQKAMDALRQTHLRGIVQLHDWDGATGQLDTMLQQAKVDNATRWQLLSKAGLARTEAEKQALIEQVETASIMSLAERYGVIPKARAAADAAGQKFTSQYVRDYIGEIVSKGNKRRAVHMAPRQGRVYAAAAQDPLRAKNAASAAARDEAVTRAHETVDKATEKVKAILRVDQKIANVDENGIPNIIANPLLETQLANSVPLVDTARIEQVLKRNSNFLARNAKAWANMRYEADRLTELKRAGGHVADSTLRGIYSAMDMLSDAGMSALRVWKYSVLFRLGYPIRIVLDDHARIWSQIGAATALLPLKEEFVGNVKYNVRTRSQMVKEAKAQLASQRDALEPLASDDMLAAWLDRDEQIRALNKRIDALKSANKRSVQTKGRKVKDARKTVRDKAKALADERDALQSLQGVDPRAYRQQIAALEAQLNVSNRQLKKQFAKRHIGDNEVVLEDGTVAQAPFGGLFGDSWRMQASSKDTWHQGLLDHEGTVHDSIAAEGGWELIGRDKPEIVRLTAWADSINNQIRQSKVAMHFIEGGDVNTFTAWLKEPAQDELRRRMAHYANDPEDWGSRVEQLVDQYVPTQQMRDLLRDRRLTKEELRSLWPDPNTWPEVHGATLAHNIGNSQLAQVTGHFFNKMFSWLSDAPTDRLSRHPYFAAVYRSEINDLYFQAKTQAERAGREFTDKDLRYMENVARKRAMNSLKQTLFDIESHSSAAHMMRFVSPFFAAHQEAMTRWWGVIADNPQIARRIQQTFDMPRKLGLVVDENGDPVKSGDTIGANHNVMLRIPAQLGGNSGFGKYMNSKLEGWAFSENSMNLILQSGSPLNPGAGPAVTVPAEALLHQLTGAEDLEKIVRLINPYPSDNAMQQLLPSTVKRLWTLYRGEKSADYMRMWQTNFDDRLVKFLESTNGRWPDADEQEQLWQQSKDETNTEAVLRFFSNAGLPFPVRPQSKFAMIQGGWQKIREQADAEGRSFDWAMDQFKAKYGEIYLPLIQSNSVNQSNLPVTNRAVTSLQRHRSLLNKIDPRLHGAVVGPEGAYTDESGYSQAAAAYLRSTSVKPQSSEKYLSYNDPEQAFRSAAERQGWSEYSDAMDTLSALATEQGFGTWRESDQLVEAREKIVAGLKERNTIWAEDYDSSLSNPKAYDYVLEDLKRIAQDRSLTSDPARTDITSLQAYLKIRDVFAQALQLREQAGGYGTMQAQANADLQEKFILIVGQLEEENLDFQKWFVNGAIDRDPFLRTEDPALAAVIGGE